MIHSIARSVNLMRTHEVLQVVPLQEGSCDPFSKQNSCSSITGLPISTIYKVFGVAPQQGFVDAFLTGQRLTSNLVLGWWLKPVYGLYLLYRHLRIPREATVYDSYALSYYVHQGQAQEGLLNPSVQPFRAGLVLRGDLRMKAIDTVEAITFMVPSVEVHSVWIQEHVAEQGQDHFQAMPPPIHEVTVEQERGSLRWSPIGTQRLLHVSQLPMQVPNDNHAPSCWNIHIHHIRQLRHVSLGGLHDLERLLKRRQDSKV
mmetsp:Transcript_45455/g.83177  ORF Transcript_45455/g.83177 Transcript_45455/m.83177 type:complete len:258 (-) Transcript_45455:618-1391(-)